MKIALSDITHVVGICMIPAKDLQKFTGKGGVVAAMIISVRFFAFEIWKTQILHKSKED